MASKATPNSTANPRHNSFSISPYLWGMAAQQPNRSCAEGTRRAFSGHGAATEEARGPLDFTSHGGYRDRIAVRGRQSGQPRCRPPERASDPKGESPERSGLSNQNPFSQGRAAGDLVPAEPKQIVGFYLTPPDKGASVTTPALTFDNAFTLIKARAAGSRAGHAHP